MSFIVLKYLIYLIKIKLKNIYLLIWDNINFDILL